MTYRDVDGVSELRGSYVEAIAAETREQCAKIAEGFKPGFCGDDKDVHRYELSEAIAAAIRAAR